MNLDETLVSKIYVDQVKKRCKFIKPSWEPRSSMKALVSLIQTLKVDPVSYIEATFEWFTPEWCRQRFGADWPPANLLTSFSALEKWRTSRLFQETYTTKNDRVVQEYLYSKFVLEGHKDKRAARILMASDPVHRYFMAYEELAGEELPPEDEMEDHVFQTVKELMEDRGTLMAHLIRADLGQFGSWSPNEA